jgi:hypothetical protein
MPRGIGAVVRHRRLFGLIGVLALFGAGSFAGLAPSGVTAATPFHYDRYFSAGYERQVDSRTCTAASTAMMLNFIARRDLNLNQLTILGYAQPRDALNDRVQRGSDPLGWSRAATYYSKTTGKATTYDWLAYTSKTTALKQAAIRIAATGMPVGLAISHGRHAVVMTGFEASRDPRLGDFTLTYVWISDPSGAAHQRYSVSGSPLNTYLELDATASYDRAWYGKYVIVVPRLDAGSTRPIGEVVTRR